MPKAALHTTDIANVVPQPDTLPSPSGVIRVLLVDHEPLLGHGIKLLMQAAPDIELVGQAEISDEAIERVAALCPDVVLMETEWPDGSGLEVLRAIKHRCPDARILVLSARSDVKTVGQMMTAGAVGYILKDIACKTLLSAIRAVYDSQTILSPEIAQQLVRLIPGRPGDDDSDGHHEPSQTLNRHDIEVLSCVARGLTDKEIAAQLVLSESAVKSRLRQLYRRLRLKNRAHAVVFALEGGLLAAAAGVGQKRTRSP